jgi:hypothetical protein
MNATWFLIVLAVVCVIAVAIAMYVEGRG